MRKWRMRPIFKIVLSMAAVVLLAIAGLCSWLFFYTGDLPNIDHLSKFAPKVQFPVFDSCLVSPSMAIPFESIGKTLGDAITAAEPDGNERNTHQLGYRVYATSWSDQIARTLMCNRPERAGRYQLDVLRLSWQIRRRFSKQQIFTIYANRAYFGPGATGVESAARQFFRKGADTLNTEEAALLAGLLRAPEIFSPDKHPEMALQRRNQVLEAMVAQGKLSASQAARAEATPVITQ